MSLRLAIFIIAISGFSIFLVNMLSKNGLFTKIEDFNIENCQTIATVSGCEDLQVDYSEDLLYLSITNWTAFFEGKPDRKGGIYTLDLKEKGAKLRHASVDQPIDFTPHGIHLYQDPQTKEKTLFVINHKKDGHFVEIFDVVDRNTLKHRETLTHKLLVSPNEIYGTGKRSFYVSQDTKYQIESWFLPIAVAFGIEEGSLVYYDGANWKLVADNLHVANGLASSSDSKTLYLGETSKRRIRVYDRDIKTGELSFKTTYDMHAGIDNFNVDSEGNIWIAGISDLITFSLHQRKPALKPPVEILKARFDGDKLVDLRRVLTSNGNTVSGVTTVSFYNNKVIMAGIMRTDVTMCTLPTKDTPQVKTTKSTDL